MAASSNASKILCKALNSARGANILDSEDSDQLQNLIIDYFSTPSAENGDEVSDEDDCEGENELVNSEESTCDEGGSDSESDDAPLVNTQVSLGDVDVANCAQFNSDQDYLRVVNFDCKCKIRSAWDGRGTQSTSTSSECAASDLSTSKKGCISQFATHEVLSKRMEMAEMTEGTFSCICLCKSLSFSSHFLLSFSTLFLSVSLCVCVTVLYLSVCFALTLAFSVINIHIPFFKLFI